VILGLWLADLSNNMVVAHSILSNGMEGQKTSSLERVYIPDLGDKPRKLNVNSEVAAALSAGTVSSAGLRSDRRCSEMLHSASEKRVKRRIWNATTHPRGRHESLPTRNYFNVEALVEAPTGTVAQVATSLMWIYLGWLQHSLNSAYTVAGSTIVKRDDPALFPQAITLGDIVKTSPSPCKDVTLNCMQLN
jgi:hypothetical protein